MQRRTTLLLLLVVLVSLAFGSAQGRSIDLRLVKHPRMQVAQSVARLQHALRQADVSYDYPMDGNVYPVGIYWTKIALGSPPQYFQVAVDSGSSDLLVPAVTCQGCHSQNTGSYDPTKSSTSRSIACTNTTYRCAQCDSGVCNFNNAYETCNLTDPTQPCTVRGPLYSDMFSMGSLQASVAFGAITFQSSNFQQFFVIDGVMGMAFDAGSSFRGTSPFQALVNAGEVSDEFAMCLNSTSGGVLTLGTPNTKYTTGAFQYTPLLSSLGSYILYVVRMKDVTINGKSIGVSSSVYSRNSLGGCVVDSGTNILLLPAAAYKGVQSTMSNLLCPGFSVPGVCSGNSIFDGYCYNYTPSQIAAFPPMSLVLDNVTLNMKPTDYIVNNGTAGVYCLGIKNTGPLGITIIGDTTMQEYYVHFDRQNKQLGWAPVNAAACV